MKTRKDYNEYMRKYHLKRYYRIRKEIIDSLGGKCARCGSTDELQVDHIDPSKKEFCIAKAILTVPKKRLMGEVGKCQVLCEKCHSLKTILEKGHKVARGNHGTISTYVYCHCEICKKAKSDYHRNWRLRNGIISKMRNPNYHGTRNGYCYHKCRCEPCRKANCEAAHKYRKGRKETL